MTADTTSPIVPLLTAKKKKNERQESTAGGAEQFARSRSSEQTLLMIPPESKRYTLVGFSVGLDWKPLQFVKPLPEYRVCGACGLVRKRTAFLPCTHTLCECCYELSAEDGIRVCPLDGRQCDEEDVDLKEFTAEDLHKREVICWNEEKGCGAVLSSSEIVQHFHRECAHHSFCCQKCSATVLCTDVSGHLRSEFCTIGTQPSSQCAEVNICKDGPALLTSLAETLGRQAEVKSFVGRLLVDSGTRSDRLNEVVHGINHCLEALRQEISEAISTTKEMVRQEITKWTQEQLDCLHEISSISEGTRECLSLSSNNITIISERLERLDANLKNELERAGRVSLHKLSKIEDSMEETKEAMNESKKTIARIDYALRNPQQQVVHCEFIVKGVRCLNEKALQRRRPEYEAEKVYLRGYRISPGVCFGYPGFRGVALYPQLRVHPGDMDNVLQWPLKGTVKACFVHPNADFEYESLALDIKVNCQRPHATSSPAFSSASSHLLSDLFTFGCVENDELTVRFDFLP